ncbi:fungal-specific transcription factor domain-containing protein [Xylaria bambusicola]|uniref:fungal-specific transcription factor domain-containing protein n=1 Tax=Xylaria bambusicola TaxID=326684 RepID=UPI002008D843|nr:fungal-specific transcription factor domain-containing protein [Xylaria bambusicola]KAI0523911.1 fungal-specific transcription factor domain-containing protein [Xylaria bambusicola]
MVKCVNVNLHSKSRDPPLVPLAQSTYLVSAQACCTSLMDSAPSFLNLGIPTREDGNDPASGPRKRRRLPSSTQYSSSTIGGNPEGSDADGHGGEAAFRADDPLSVEDPFSVGDPLAGTELFAIPEVVWGGHSDNYTHVLNHWPTLSDSVFPTFQGGPTDDIYNFGRPNQSPRTVGEFTVSLPDRASRIVPLNLGNLYADNVSNRLESINSIATFSPRNGEVNGYVKCRILPSDVQEERVSSRPLRYERTEKEVLQNTSEEQASKPESHRAVERALRIGKEGSVLRIPPNFGLGCKLTIVERKIFKFYIDAWCSGRTILPKTNSWKVDLGCMLPSSEPLKNALLAIACTYILDYVTDDRMRTRANKYYHDAVVSLNKQLQQPQQWEIGKGDDLIGTFALLNMHDVVAWEFRRPPGQLPRWLEGARAACKILDTTDPGYRYYKPYNVQATRARIGNTINIARHAIAGLTFTPLDIENTQGKFGWLLYGTEHEVHEIHGACGYCPKLLHMWSQITHLSAKFALNGDNDVIPLLAEKFFDKLGCLVQNSELSRGFGRTDDLLQACVLNESGVVEEPWQMVALGAECWKIAAQIYLLCRLLRYPRSSPRVLAKLDQLAECVRRIPCSGSLFTSMTPFFPCFLLGILSVQSRHRAVAQNWCEIVMSSNQCRSSVPPSYEIMKRLWLWMDSHLRDPVGPVSEDIEGRDAWWEKLVARAMATEGVLCIH